MKKGGVGGANTKTGLAFEAKYDLPTFIAKQNGYVVVPNDKDGVKLSRWIVKYESEEIGEIFQKDGLYRYFNDIGYDYTKVISKKLLPDDSIFVITRNTIYIVEKKNQEVAGSVDEKLQTCDFKKKQYTRLFAPLNKEVEYAYLLKQDWFSRPEYKDVLDYIISVGCKYYFDYIPLETMGLPVPEKK